MKKIRQWVDHLSVKKKLIFYGYLTITPVLIVICLALLVNNYHKVQDEKLKNDTASVDTLAESLGILQTDIKDFSTYICINNDIHALLTTEDVKEKNKNAKLWLEEAPMAIVQDMMALKGHIKTIAIYPENGIRPYLRCMDGSAYINDLDVVRSTDIYGETLASKNGMVWKSVPKGSGDTYLTNRSDKIVLYREIFDLTQKKTLGYIAIGVSQEYFQNLCQNITKNEKESVLILDKNSSIVCKIVPAYGLQMQVLDIAYMPLILLIGMLIGLMPLLMIISNLVTKPLRRLCEAINEFSTGDFEQ